MIVDATYFSQYILQVWIGVNSITVEIILNPAIGGASPGSGVANPSAILLRMTESVNLDIV